MTGDNYVSSDRAVVLPYKDRLLRDLVIAPELLFI